LSLLVLATRAVTEKLRVTYLRFPALRVVPAIAAAFFLAAPPGAAADEPYKRMLDDELVFTGAETLTDSGTAKDAIVIGLFAPDDDDHPVGSALTRGVTLAVDQANAAGGIEGRPIRLIRRWADDPWAAGANEVVKLVFEDQAWAIIGGPDGASTHIAQQVATKAHIPLIAPVSSDSTLTHTRVPWIFRLPPDDASQAEILVAGAVVPRNLKRVGLVTSTDHDGRTVAAELIAALERAGLTPVFHLKLAPDAVDPTDLASRIAGFKADGVIIRVPRTDLRRLTDAFAAAGLEIPIFLPWIPGLDLRQFPLRYPGPVTSVAPFEPARACGPNLKLARAFIERHGETPTPVAVYGYDAANLVISAFGSGATGRADLRRSLAELKVFHGASGAIRWDTGGGNRGDPVLTPPVASAVVSARGLGTDSH